MLDLETLVWSSGPELPYKVFAATSVPLGDRFLLVGGETYGFFLNTIYEFDPLEMDWILRTEELQEARYAPFAAIASANYLGCN